MRKRSSFNLVFKPGPSFVLSFLVRKAAPNNPNTLGLISFSAEQRLTSPMAGFFEQLICNKTHEFLHLQDPQYDTERQQEVKGPLNVLRVLCGFTLTGWLIYLSSGVGGRGGYFTAESNSLLWSSGRHKQRVFVFYLPPGMMESPAQKNERAGGEGEKMDGSPLGSFVSTFSSFQRGRSPVWFL